MMKRTVKLILLLLSMLPNPPSPFLDARDLNARYASQVRKLSNQPVLTDGDVVFRGVDTFTPPHELPAGMCAAAVNKRFEDGRAWPRNGSVQQGWGATPSLASNLVGVQHFAGTAAFGNFYLDVNGFVVGEQYLVWTLGNCSAFGNIGPAVPNPVTYAPGMVFTATQTTYAVVAHSVAYQPCTAVIVPLGGCNVQGYGRFNDPQGNDVQVLVTDDWRTLAGEDGGWGRVWLLDPGNAPVEVSLNGQDVWGATRLVPCYNGLVLLRQGNERHYFTGVVTVGVTNTATSTKYLTIAATAFPLTTGQACTTSAYLMAAGGPTYYVRVVNGTTVTLYDTAAHAVAGGSTGLQAPVANGRGGFLYVQSVNNSQIQLNGPVDWMDGDLVLFNGIGNGYFNGTTPPALNTRYYVKTLTGNVVELFSDSGLTTQLSFTGAVGQFYLERQAATPGFYGNGAPPLLAQPGSLGQTLWDEGFGSVPTAVLIGSVNNSVVTAANHGLLPGDAVVVTGITLSGGGAVSNPCYAAPSSANTFTLYDTAADALANNGTGQYTLSATVAGGANVVKSGASGLPMPSGREGCYFQNRLCIVNGTDTLVVSDPLDPLHFSPFTAAVTANMGESDAITGLVPLPAQNALLILKQNSVLLLGNFSGGSANWTLTTVTREYGCIAPLSAAQVGADVWFLSRKGVASIRQTELGITQGVADPVSRPMKKYIDLIDWGNASLAAGQYWNNRYYLAVPLKGQAAGSVQNNGWLVYNFLNQAWEGLWQGTTLPAYGLARLTVFGEERLTWANPNGLVFWLGDGYADAAYSGGQAPVVDSLTTRVYTCGQVVRKLHLAATVQWWTLNPSITVTAQTPGVNESEQLVPSPVTYDSTQYDVQGLGTYTPGQGVWANPYREDYSLSPAELLSGGVLDTYQNHTEAFRMRMDDWGVQLVIGNSQGSCLVQTVTIRAVGGPNMDTQRV